MPDAYWGGLLEGFTGRRDEELQRNFANDAARRQQEGKVFEYLLQSQDPEMRALAMSGLLESARPGSKAKGLRGFMGEVQGSQTYPMVLSRMNEMVPDTSSAPTPPAAPGSAAMSTNQAVRPGAAPISLPGQQLPPEGPPAGAVEGPPEMAPLGPQGMAGAGMPPPPPPESKWKRRGTGVPTAEEIAESNARAGVEGRIKAVTAGLMAQGASPEEIKRAVMGIAGAPQPLDTTANGPVMADPADPETPIPTIRHRDGTVTLTDGSPLPPNYVGYAKTTTAGRVTKTMKDPSSPTGYASVTYDPTGVELFRVPTEFVPPPAYAGTTQTAEPGTGVPVVSPVLRVGGVGDPLGDAPKMVESQAQGDAKALIETVNKRMQEERFAGLPAEPGQRDQITAEEARKLGLTFKTYGEAERAARATPPVTARERTTGGSMVERIRARAEANRRGAAPAPPPPPPPPSGPSPTRSNRGRGAGPGPVR